MSVHGNNRVLACVANKMVLTEEEAIESVEDMAIEFSFRQNRLDQETAQSLFSQGLLSGEGPSFSPHIFSPQTDIFAQRTRNSR